MTAEISNMIQWNTCKAIQVEAGYSVSIGDYVTINEGRADKMEGRCSSWLDRAWLWAPGDSPLEPDCSHVHGIAESRGRKGEKVMVTVRVHRP